MLYRYVFPIYPPQTWHFSFSRCGFPVVSPRCLTVHSSRVSRQPGGTTRHMASESSRYMVDKWEKRA